MKPTFQIAYIGLGSNLGDRVKHIQDAINGLKQECIQIAAISQLYETTPAEVTEPQPNYLNAVIRINTTLSLFDLFSTTHTLEYTLGRRDKGQKKPRIIDMDILLYAEENHQSEKLEVPHPQILKRQFVMIPLSEVLTSGWPSHFMKIEDACHQFKQNMPCFKAKVTI